MKTKERNIPGLNVSTKPIHENLPWPGLKSKDRLSRIVTRAVKERMETAEVNAWAKNQIARVLDLVPPEVAIRFVLRELDRRQLFVPLSANAALKLLGL